MQWGDSNNTAPRKTGDKWRNCTRTETRAGQTLTGEQWRGGRKFTDGLVRGTWRTNNPTRRGEFADSSTNTPTVSSIIIMQLLQARNGGQRGNLWGHLQRRNSREVRHRRNYGTRRFEKEGGTADTTRARGRRNMERNEWSTPKYITERTAKTLSESTRRMYQNLAKERNHRTQSSREGSPSTLREKRIKYRPPIPEAYQDRSTTEWAQFMDATPENVVRSTPRNLQGRDGRGQEHKFRREPRDDSIANVTCRD